MLNDVNGVDVWLSILNECGRECKWMLDSCSSRLFGNPGHICVCVRVCVREQLQVQHETYVSCICAWNVQHIIFWLAGIATASGMVGLISGKLFYKTDQRSLSVHCICKRCYLWRLQIHDSENVNFRIDFSENYVRPLGLKFIAQFLSDVSAVGICKTIVLWASDS